MSDQPHVHPMRSVLVACGWLVSIGVIGVLLFRCTVPFAVELLDPGSRTRVPDEAMLMSYEEQFAATKMRAEEIRVAVKAYQQQLGRLPEALTDLVPQFLPSIPAPLVSTMPFEFHVKRDGIGFIIMWEAWPDSDYERKWIDQDGVGGSDT